MASQPPPPVLTLTVEKGPRKGEIRQCIAGSALRVGRVVKGNDLAVRDVGASQQHLAIEFLPPPASRWAVSDLGSSNGSFLNGAPLVPSVPAPLSDGDLIKIGESTVLAVSLASDSDLSRGAAAAAGPRRSSRCPGVPAAAEEKKPPSGTRRGTRKKAAVVEVPELEDELLDAAAVVVEEEKPRAVTRRGGRKKAAASDPPEPEKDEEEKEEPPVVTRRGRQKKEAEHPEPEKDEETEVAPVVTQLEGSKKAVEPPEPEPGKEEEKRRGRRKKATEVPEPGKEEEAKVEAPVATRRSARNKGVATFAAPPPPAKTRSRRGRGRGARTASTREAVVPEDEDVEEQEEIEVAKPREPTANHLSTSTVVKSAEAEKIAAGDGEIKAAAKEAPEVVEVAKEATGATVANNGCDKENDGGEDEEEDGKAELVGSGGEAGGGEKVEERAGRSSLDTMTLGEWFGRMEKYLVRKIDEYAEQSIVELEDQERRLYEYISTLGKQL